MLKKHYALPALSLIFAAASVEAAPPTAELIVKGDLTVPVCTVASADNGTYDLGKISSTKIKASGDTALTAVNQSWTITCDADTYLVFKPIDNRDGTASDTSNISFGLGTVNTTGKIGYYRALMKNAAVDGKPSSTFVSTSGAFNIASTANLTKGSYSGWASATSTLQAGKVFTTDITVSPVLANTTVMKGAITDEVKVDGSMTLNFAYGI